MGTAELDIIHKKLIIRSHIITYGNAADRAITELIREEIATMWNEPQAAIVLKGREVLVQFNITADYRPAIDPQEIIENTDPKNNYFRIEEYAIGNISFVDGLGCNTGYFKKENLYKGSTTAAHEYGHTLGLKHPADIDWRGMGIPGIMFPRGSLVDPAFQYNPQAIAGDSSNGGTLHPRFRKVRAADIDLLKLHKLSFEASEAVIGEFSSIWHPGHAEGQHDLA